MHAMFKRHTDEVTSISFSPDGHSLVSGSRDCSVCIWNIRDGSPKELPVTDDADYFLSVVFSPDGRYIAAGDLKTSLWIWDSRTHKLVANLSGHSRPVWCVEYTPDGEGLTSGSSDTTVRYWDVSSLGIHEARETAVPRHSFPLIQSFSGHTVRFYFYFIACSLSRHPHLQNTVYSIAFFPSNDERIVTASRDGSVRVWDIRTGVWQLVVQGHTESITAVDVSRTENFLVTASVDHHVTLWRYEVF